ncbi:uncharacterized protein PRCAT00001559001 [Priceomyces carsonii]|uniref:uncharacterized protein n=1 Tax=Priceomyces carsonii TaxID=28549 RepID=UPI002ED8F4BE|nr:unnamed protein product [Priceomyces carsonii]
MSPSTYLEDESSDGAAFVPSLVGPEKDVEKAEVEEDPNIDGGYAYFIILASFLLNFCTWGMNSGFAIYFAYYLNNDTFEGATKIDYSYIGGMAFGVGLFFAPVINYIQGLIGTRPTIIVGNCLQFTALMLASWSRSLWQLYLTQGLMQSFGLAFISLPSLSLLPQWFKKKRTFASGLATAGSGAGGVVFNLGMQKVLSSRSVFWALRCQSIIGFGVAWIAILMIRTRTKQHHIEFSVWDSQCVSCGGFWLLAFYLITCMFGYVILLYTLANFTTSLGYSEYQGSIVSAMVQVGSVLGRPIVGLASDKLGPCTVASSCYYIVAIFCLAMWIPARNYATVIIFALIEGSLMGTVYGTLAPIVAHLVGMPKLNVTFCMLWLFVGAAGVFSPVIGVKLTAGAGNEIDPTRYRNCSIFAGVAFFACATSMLLLRGFLKAREELIESEKDADEGGQLYVFVKPTSMLRGCFKRTNTPA